MESLEARTRAGAERGRLALAVGSLGGYGVHWERRMNGPRWVIGSMRAPPRLRAGLKRPAVWQCSIMRLSLRLFLFWNLQFAAIFMIFYVFILLSRLSVTYLWILETTNSTNQGRLINRNYNIWGFFKLSHFPCKSW